MNKKLVVAFSQDEGGMEITFKYDKDTKMSEFEQVEHIIDKYVMMAYDLNCLVFKGEHDVPYYQYGHKYLKIDIDKKEGDMLLELAVKEFESLNFIECKFE